jgi:DNA-binding HxlR family transcriptional regulator
LGRAYNQFVSRYGQFCPVAKASEILAERWTPLVLRELLAGSHRFNELCRGVPLMSRSLLSTRLRQLERAGIVDRRPVRGQKAEEYYLTDAGEELRPIIEGLGVWGQRWVVGDVEETDLDPSLLMWDIRRSLVSSAVPEQRVVLRFDLSGVEGPMGRWWLLAGAGEADLCMTDPGFEVDLVLSASLLDLTRYWTGRCDWDELVRDGRVRLEGPRWLQRSLPSWLGRSSFAGTAKPQR